MKQPPQRETHHKELVWVNPTTESLRKEECLCLNCGRLKPGQPDNCPHAQTFFGACVMGNIALAVTRCRDFQSKTVWLYKHTEHSKVLEAGPYGTQQAAKTARDAHARIWPDAAPSEPEEVPWDHNFVRD